MRRGWIYIGIVSIGSLIFYFLTPIFLPDVIYSVFQYKAKNERGYVNNEMIYMPLPDDQARAVVMPNPDFMYVACFYDLSDGPLQITGNMPDSSYWSVSFYQPNTINWYIKNDLEYETNHLDLILAMAGQDLSGLSQKEMAVSPVTKGFMLIRILVTDHDPAVVRKYERWQKSIELERF